MSPSRKTQPINPNESSNQIELIVEEDQGEQEYVVEPTDPKLEAWHRRKAYDAHLKTDIMMTGRHGSMNATYNPTYLYRDPYLIPYARYTKSPERSPRAMGPHVKP